MKTTNRIFNWTVWRVVALLGLLSVLSVPPVFAQHFDTAARRGLQGLTFSRHADTPFTLATAQTAMTNATTVLQMCNAIPNATEDVACQVTLQVAGGAVGTFGATMDEFESRGFTGVLHTFSGINALRQHVKPEIRIHVLTQG